MKIFNFFLVITSLLVFTCCTVKERVKYSKEFTNVSSTGTKEVKVGENFAVKLDSQPGTGYLWVISEISKNLEIVEQSTYSTENEDDRVGGIEKQVFTFKARSEGKAMIEIHYKRVWEKKKKPAKVYNLNLNLLKK